MRRSDDGQKALNQKETKETTKNHVNHKNSQITNKNIRKSTIFNHENSRSRKSQTSALFIHDTIKHRHSHRKTLASPNSKSDGRKTDPLEELKYRAETKVRNSEKTTQQITNQRAYHCPK